MLGSQGFTERFFPLQGSDSPHDDPLDDFPLRETDSARTGSSTRLKPDSTRPEPEPALVAPVPDPVYVEPARPVYDEPAPIADPESVRMTYAEPPLFGASSEPALFASAVEEPRRRSGLSIWFAAAVSLVFGIVIGFASGYSAGQGSQAAPPAADAAAPTSGAASPGQPFSESTVPEPVRVDPQEVVPSPAPSPTPATPTVARTPPAAPEKARPTVTVPPAAPDAGVPAAPAPRRGVARPTTTIPSAVVEEKPPLTGPASLQVVSRPAGAEVIVDGMSVGRTPLSMEMSPGAHEIRLSLPGFKGWATTVNVKAGTTTRVSGSLEQ